LQYRFASFETAVGRALSRPKDRALQRRHIDLHEKLMMESFGSPCGGLYVLVMALLILIFGTASAPADAD